MIFLPSLTDKFLRLAALHPDWSYAIGAKYLDGINWNAGYAMPRDMDWMLHHLELERRIISTIAGLGWGYHYQEGSPPPMTPRWVEIHRGYTVEDARGEWWVSYGPPHRASGLTDLHAMLTALVDALEVHTACGLMEQERPTAQLKGEAGVEQF